MTKWNVIYKIDGLLSDEDKEAIENLDIASVAFNGEDNTTVIGLHLITDSTGEAVVRAASLIRGTLGREQLNVAEVKVKRAES
jgi:hypothetical protein